METGKRPLVRRMLRGVAGGLFLEWNGRQGIVCAGPEAVSEVGDG